MNYTTQILLRIEEDVIDEATIQLSELVGPNSLEFDMQIDDFVDAKLCAFHAALYTSIHTEMLNHV